MTATRPSPPTTRAHSDSSQEGQANAIVVSLHGLVNLVARTLEFDSDLTASELRTLGVSRDQFAPGSTHRKAWFTWTAGVVAHFVTMAGSRDPRIQAAVGVLDQIAKEQAMVDLIELRNTQYHRWHGESAGVMGIAHGELPAADQLASGRAVSFGREMLPPYLAGQDTLDEAVAASRDALDAVVLHMDDFLTAWAQALPGAS